MPGQKRGPWSANEDQVLLHLVNLHGAHNWVRISGAIQTRSPKQCRERFHQNLKPNLNHEPITPEEGILIEQLVAEMGKRWAEIARRLRGRSDNAVKNWWNGGMNRRRRSHNQRRAEVDVQHQHQHQQQQHEHQQQQPLPQQGLQPHNHHQTPTNMHPIGLVVPPNMAHPVMPTFQSTAQYFSQPMYAATAAPTMHHHMNVPNASHMMNRATNLMIDPPLPSPSAYSQLSADGPPSLVSDCSTSGRSPNNNNNNTSPIELPPIAGGQSNDRRQSSAPVIRLEVPGNAYGQPGDFQMPLQMKQVQPMLQDAFQPQPSQQHQQQMNQAQQQFSHPHPMQFLPSQPRRASPMEQVHMHVQHHHLQQQQQEQHLHQSQQYQPSQQHQQQQVPPNHLQHHQQSHQQQQQHFLQTQQHHQYQIASHMLQRDMKSIQPSLPSTPLQLPGISHLPASMGELDSRGLPVDPALQTPTGHHSLTTPDGSPKDKMSLSNLTH